MTQQVTQEDVYESLKSVFDPEIPVNVVDLGLIYDVQVTEGDVYVQMTLTFPGCGMGPYIAQQAEWAIQEIEGVEEVNIEMVFEPAWSPDLNAKKPGRNLAFRAASVIEGPGLDNYLRPRLGAPR